MTIKQGAKKFSVCLIVDNPLRDLDGLVLIAKHLAESGVDVWLVPMYYQEFDVKYLNPDLVLVNYVRFNNRRAILGFMAAGIKVAVLDTEGVGGKNADDYSKMVACTGLAARVDLYCVWGQSQKDALIRNGVVSSMNVLVTGCPRYDFGVEPWNKSIDAVDINRGYLLVNTNFPMVNPKFTKKTNSEVATAVKAGFSLSFAEAYANDAKDAHHAIISLVREIAVKNSCITIVIRPHPFESANCYKILEELGNVIVRQSGTSIQWISQASALLHLNCSTAVEAAIIGVPALTPKWLNTPILNVPGPSSVSEHYGSVDEINIRLNKIIREEGNRRSFELPDFIFDLYYKLDGQSSMRVACGIIDELNKCPKTKDKIRLSFNQKLNKAIRNCFGPKVTRALKDFLRLNKNNSAKSFSVNEIRMILERIQKCEKKVCEKLEVSRSGSTGFKSLLHSGQSVLIKGLGK